MRLLWDNVVDYDDPLWTEIEDPKSIDRFTCLVLFIIRKILFSN